MNDIKQINSLTIILF